MIEKFQMLHPDPTKRGVNVEKQKYEYIRDAVLAILKNHQPMTPKDLFEHMTKDYSAKFDGKIGWYTEGVKLDLEARGVVAHDRKTRQITLL